MQEVETLSEPQIEASAAVPSACERLAPVLESYEKTATELEEFRGCITLAEKDENSALEDESITEDEVVERIGDAQKRRAVYAVRVARRERELSTLGAELEQTCKLAEREFVGRINQESSRRSAIVRERLLGLLNIDGNPDVLISVELSTILRHSRPVRAIEDLRPNCYYQAGDVGYTVRAAHAILECLRAFEAEKAKTV
jgi:hypothetical protein